MRPIDQFVFHPFVGFAVLGLLGSCGQSSDGVSSAATSPATTPPSQVAPTSRIIGGETFSFDSGMIDGARILVSAVDKQGRHWSYLSDNSGDALPVSDGIGRFVAEAPLPFPASITVFAEREGFVQPCGMRQVVDTDAEFRIEMVSASSLDTLFSTRPQWSAEPSLTGIVIDATKGRKPVAGATIRVEEFLPMHEVARLEYHDEVPAVVRVANTLTNRGGEYFLCNLGAEIYLRVSKAGYQNLRIGPVDASTTRTLTIELERAKPAPSATALAFVRDGKIYRTNSDGSDAVQLSDGPGDADPAWSPDGSRIAFARTRGDSKGIYIMSADGTNLVRRTSGSADGGPNWSPDGEWIVFSGPGAGGRGNVSRFRTVDDGMDPFIIIDRPGINTQPAWSPDGSQIVFISDWAAYDFTSDIFTTDAAGSAITQLTFGFGFGGSLIEYYHPAWSPDGRKLAIVTCQIAFVTCGTSTIAVLNADGTGLMKLTTDGSSPAWSPDGQIIAFGSSGSILWVSADGSDHGVIVHDGHSPSWHP